MANTVLIQNGTVADSNGLYQADILVENGLIKAVGKGLSDSEAAVYDATGKYVFPGIIDPHVQLEINFGAFPMTDGFDSGTVAAAAGGVTTIIDFADQPKGVPIVEELKNRRRLADGVVNVDYSLHLGITDTSVHTIEEIQKIICLGIPSFKLYMAYSRRDRMVNEGQINHIMEEVSKYQGVVGIHGENDNFVEYQIARLKAEGKTALQYFTQARPVVGEEIAVRTAILLAERNRCKLYVHHVSCQATLEAIKEGRQRGVQIYAETCPAYLSLTEAEYQKPGGEIFLLNPALRRPSDVEALWQGIFDGEIDTLGTDHCSYTLEQKHRNKDNFDAIPAGLPGVELLLPVMYTLAQERGLPLPKLLRLMTRNPAQIFGIAPQKGLLLPGSDGDLVVFDPNQQWTVRPEDLLMNVDFTPFDGWKLTGKVAATFLRGEKLFENGSFLGARHQGQFLFGKTGSYQR